MKTLEVTQAGDLLAGYVQRVEQEPFVLTVDGKPVAAVVALDDIDWESLSLSTNPQFIEIIERSRASQKAEGGISLEEIERKFHIDDNPLFSAYAEVYGVLAGFGGYRLPGCLLNAERDLVGPRFDDVQMNGSTPDADDVVNIVAEGKEGRWLAMAVLATDNLDAALDGIMAEAALCRATPWLVVFADVPEQIKHRAAQQHVLVTDNAGWAVLKAVVEHEDAGHRAASHLAS